MACALGGCVDPHYGEDVSAATDGSMHPDVMPFASSSDASVDARAQTELPKEPPAWALPLLGDYAMRVRIYGTESTTGNLISATNETISAVQFRYDAASDRVLVDTQMCRNHAELSFGQNGAIKYPALYPVRTQRVQFEGGTFSTESLDTGAVGYVDAVPAGCVPGKQIDRSADQTWLGATCTCPSDNGLPTVREDCRLTDPDHDMKPGFTIAFSGTITSEDYCVTRDTSRMVAGKIDPDGHHIASYLVYQDSYQIECAQGGCTRAKADICRDDDNTALFAKVEPQKGGALWNCDALLAAVDRGGLLPNDPPTFPSNCHQ